jgi:hypothetical protein
MSIFGNFDATKVEPAGDFTPLPEGMYTVVVEECEEKTTKAGTGKYLACVLKVVDGEHQGRTVFYNLNIENPSAKAQAIGLAQLSALCRAINVTQPKTASELCYKPFVARIVCKKGGDGEVRNEVKKVVSVKAHAESGDATAAPEAAGDKAPWEK